MKQKLKIWWLILGGTPTCMKTLLSKVRLLRWCDLINIWDCHWWQIKLGGRLWSCEQEGSPAFALFQEALVLSYWPNCYDHVCFHWIVLSFSLMVWSHFPKREESFKPNSRVVLSPDWRESAFPSFPVCQTATEDCFFYFRWWHSPFELWAPASPLQTEELGPKMQNKTLQKQFCSFCHHRAEQDVNRKILYVFMYFYSCIGAGKYPGF